MNKKTIHEKIKQMTVEEKASLCIGKDFWHTREIERLSIPQTMLTDGPFGLRKQVKAVDHMGLSESNVAICFPAGCTLASGFDEKLARLMGTELGKLAQMEDVGVVLGPALNIKRSPLCGRNFEYYSEDPLVSSQIAEGVIEGIQSQNVAACPKHFLANNQEYYRQTSDSVVDERTLHEIYLAAFEGAVRYGKPWTIMGAYNLVNGTYACQNKQYLTDILRKEWAFDGYAVTDWGACDDPIKSIEAGMDLIMPGPGTGHVSRIVDAVRSGDLSETLLDQAVERILTTVFRYTENHLQNATYDFEVGHEAAACIAKESAVLLKNEDQILPLKENEKLAIIGSFAKNPRYQGGGSSHVHPYKVTGAWDFLKNRTGILYVEGYRDDMLDDEAKIQEAVNASRQADKAIIFVGLPESYETEGVDRKHLNLPECQNKLIEAVAQEQPNTIVVLHNGSPVAMPWLEKVKAVLEMYLAGEAVGQATVDLLYGTANPCGRLAETFPICVEDTPTYPYYGVERDQVIYREGVFVGYRYYETRKQQVLFPFGHGLSYTEFNYSQLEISRDELSDGELLEVSVIVTNSGKRAGKEVVQLYVAPESEEIVRPIRELKAFTKIWLEPEESKKVTFQLGKHAFAFWDIRIHDWNVLSGSYSIQIGRSSRNILLEKRVLLHSTTEIPTTFTINSCMGDLTKNPIASRIMSSLMGNLASHSKKEAEDTEKNGIMSKSTTLATAAAMPLRSLISFRSNMSREQLEEMVQEINEEIEREYLQKQSLK